MGGGYSSPLASQIQVEMVAMCIMLLLLIEGVFKKEARLVTWTFAVAPITASCGR